MVTIDTLPDARKKIMDSGNTDARDDFDELMMLATSIRECGGKIMQAKVHPVMEELGY